MLIKFLFLVVLTVYISYSYKNIKFCLYILFLYTLYSLRDCVINVIDFYKKIRSFSLIGWIKENESSVKDFNTSISFIKNIIWVAERILFILGLLGIAFVSCG